MDGLGRVHRQHPAKILDVGVRHRLGVEPERGPSGRAWTHRMPCGQVSRTPLTTALRTRASAQATAEQTIAADDLEEPVLTTRSRLLRPAEAIVSRAGVRVTGTRPERQRGTRSARHSLPVWKAAL